MDRQATTKSDLECILRDKTMEAKALSLSLLKCITNDFSESNKIGCGGFSVVYKGLLENWAVAVKKLSKEFVIHEEKFLGEVSCLMKGKHKNIVRFLGYCSDTQGQWKECEGKSVMAEDRQRLLCFEFLPNGSLDKYIQDASRKWENCYQIIKGVCEGLHYLHERQIVHLDLKPANIILDDDMLPKITDFGISRCIDGKQTHVFTKNIIGSMGYISPESVNDGQVSFKSDIYSLGIIIIEMLTAKKAYPDVKDVLECWRHKVEKSQEEQQLEQIRVCTEVAQSCLDFYPARRPSAQGIIDILERTESKEIRIETGASCSLVKKENKSIGRYRGQMLNNSAESMTDNLKQTERKERVEDKKKSPRIEPFRHVSGTFDSETFARTCRAVTQTISELYAQCKVSRTFEDLYRDAYNMVLYKKGEELYSSMETTMTSEVQSLCTHLDTAPADGALFLQELLAEWNRHTRAVEMTNDILMYMDRTFVPTRRKTPIRELGLRLWRDHLVCSDKIRPRLVDAVKKQRGGEDKLVVAGVKKMLTELREDVPGLFFPDGELHDVAGP